MCCEDLVCARCGGHVVEAGCPACRASKAAVHGSGFSLSPQLLVLLLALLSLLALLATRR